MRLAALTIVCVGAVTVHAASYTTYIGDVSQYQVTAIATDAAGNAYVAGSRLIGGSSQPFYSAASDVFVSKVDSSGNLTLLATFSGKGSDRANGIAVDPTGNIYIAGSTTSPDFPLRNALQSVPQAATAGTQLGTGFVMKLDSNGDIVYSTYLGGTLGWSALYGVAADAEGNAYVTGTTAAPDYPHSAGMPAGTVYPDLLSGLSGAFFAKINPSGGEILYGGALTAPVHECEGGSSCFLSSVGATGAAIAVDAAGNAYIAGNTNGGGLPATSGVLQTSGTGAFVAKVNAAGTDMVYVTYLASGTQLPGLGTEATDGVAAIAADDKGNAYLAGTTQDSAFPVTAGAFQTAIAGTPSPNALPAADAFVAKLNATGSAMVWATLLGGSGSDEGRTIAVDGNGNVWVSGTTQSTDFPSKVPVSPNGGEFLAELNSTGTALSYGALFPSNTVAAALALGPNSTLLTAGTTGLISEFPVDSAPGLTSAPWMFGVANAAGGPLGGRFAPAELISIYGLHLGPATPVTAAFDAAGFLPATLGGIQVMISGIAAPLLYVSGTQINAVAPKELTPGAAIALQITANGVALPDFRVMVDAADPQVFQSGGSAAAINQDGTVNSQANPAPVGSYVQVWATGTGLDPDRDGQMATAANEFCSQWLLYCVVYQEDGTVANVYYSGAAPGTVTGVIQINFQVSASQTYYFNTGTVNSGEFVVYTSQ
ncbi:MAG TPA: SBBP repeat-containing protein [Bryobacteraceae bacterium]|nr:SBBP repeat-containing protein [Bryobacteraceae bacterium]